MTDHLPECYLSGPPSLCPMCESLRACEQRVRDEERSGAPVVTVGADGFGRGYNRGYFAALEAVEQAIRDALSDDGRNLYAELTSLAAIDALREVEK